MIVFSIHQIELLIFEHRLLLRRGMLITKTGNQKGNFELSIETGTSGRPHNVRMNFGALRQFIDSAAGKAIIRVL